MVGPSAFPRKCACRHSRCGLQTVLMGDTDRDEGLPISVRLEMCLAERERGQSGCRASGLTPERSRGAGSVAAASAAFARCGGNDNSVDFTRAGHRIVQSMLRLSFFF